ncbi:MAG TPA: M24 family metallopeptidase, partial [Candidatus Paceibacterota bacterium]
MARFHFADTSDSDMFYAVGGNISDPFFLIEMEGKSKIFLNALEIDAFIDRNKNPAIEALPLDPFQQKAKTSEKGNELGKLALAILESSGLSSKPLGVSRKFPLDVADYLRSRGVVLSVKTPFMPERAVKSSQEIGCIREALTITDHAFKIIEQILSESHIEDQKVIYREEILTSEFLKKRASSFLFENGMDDPEGMIISSGAQAAMPHHKGAGPIRPNETIVCDLFPRSRESGYFADMTRSYVKGAPSPHAAKMYEAVKLAQDKAFELIRPGVQARDVHNAAAKAIKSAGFEV